MGLLGKCISSHFQPQKCLIDKRLTDRTNTMSISNSLSRSRWARDVHTTKLLSHRARADSIPWCHTEDSSTAERSNHACTGNNTHSHVSDCYNLSTHEQIERARVISSLRCSGCRWIVQVRPDQPFFWQRTPLWLLQCVSVHCRWSSLPPHSSGWPTPSTQSRPVHGLQNTENISLRDICVFTLSDINVKCENNRLNLQTWAYATKWNGKRKDQFVVRGTFAQHFASLGNQLLR